VEKRIKPFSERKHVSHPCTTMMHMCVELDKKEKNPCTLVMHCHVWHGFHEKKEKTFIHPPMQCTKKEKENKRRGEMITCLAQCASVS
jgi:hypothetical protein